jgi:hypothetical protein
MNVTVEKVKVVKAPTEVKPDVKVEVKPQVVLTETGFQPVKAEEKPSVLEKLETVLTKLMGTYDGNYQEEVKGVPGTAEAPEGGEKPEGEQHDTKAEGSYDGKYQEGHDPEDDDEGEECTCSACGSKYKMKKAKKAEEEEKKMEEEEEKKAEEEVLPKKAELSAEVKPDLSVDAWRANFFSATGVTPSKSAQDWMSACDTFTKTISKE